jgi:hypothetical protein
LEDKRWFNARPVKGGGGAGAELDEMLLVLEVMASIAAAGVLVLVVCQFAR